MTTTADAQLLIDVLDRQFDYLLKLQGTARLLRLRNVLEFVRDEPRLAGFLEDSRVEACAELRRFEAADLAIRSQLAELWAACEEVFREHLDDELDVSLRAYGGGLAGYAARLHAPPPVTMPGPGSHFEREHHTQYVILRSGIGSRRVSSAAFSDRRSLTRSRPPVAPSRTFGACTSTGRVEFVMRAR